MPPSSRLSIVFATDEDIVAIAGADYAALVPSSQRVAYGTDGVFAGVLPWVLTSSSVDFAVQGVTSGMVCQLTQPKSVFRGQGDLLACESASGGSLTLRRIGWPVGWGQPISPMSGVVGVEFTIETLGNQIEDVAYMLEERFAVDPRMANRNPQNMYDQRIFRRLTAYQVVLRQYEQMTRNPDLEFSEKIKIYERRYREELEIAVVRWGPTGTSQPSTSFNQTRLSR